VFEDENLYAAGAVSVNPTTKPTPFTNALHASYNLNGLEREIALAIDTTGLDWMRNPDNGGFAIPLLDKGDTRHFFPDFLIWKDGLIFAVDPKGGHLLAKDAWRKLLNITDEKGNRKVLVRLISAGKWNDQLQEVGPKGKGFTVWSVFKSTGKLRARYAATVTEAVEIALKPS
jgi:type III restriction enzyme